MTRPLSESHYTVRAEQILKLLVGREMSISDLSHVMKCDPSGINSALAYLREQNLIHVSGYRHVKKNFRRLFKLGYAEDAVRPKASQNAEDVAELVLSAFDDEALSSEKIKATVKASRFLIVKAISILRASNRIHIVGYVGRMHIYRAGAGKDALMAKEKIKQPNRAALSHHVAPPRDALMSALFGPR